MNQQLRDDDDSDAQEAQLSSQDHLDTSAS